MTKDGERRLTEAPAPLREATEAIDRRDALRAITVSAVGLGVAGVLELGIALLSGSVGLLSDALHNLADVSTSPVVFIGLRLSKRPADEVHSFGWDRAEDIAGLGIALLIWISAGAAAEVSIRKLVTHGGTSHLGFGVAAAAVGIVANQIVARYKMRIGRRIHSATLVADAQHSWLDALSSAGALLGLVGVAAGWHWADAVAGLVVTGFICHVAYEVTSDLLQHLMDGVEPGLLNSSSAAASQVPGVVSASTRARWMGRTLLIEVEGVVAPETTMQDSDAIGAEVESAIRQVVPESRIIRWIPRSR